MIRMLTPPQSIVHIAGAIVERNETVDGDVVRILPEPRMSIQIACGDPYYIREQGSDSCWHRVPPTSLWGPRYAYGYGFARTHIHILAIELRPLAFAAIAGLSAKAWVNRVGDFASIAPDLSKHLEHEHGESLEDWIERIEPILSQLSVALCPELDLAPALPMLATLQGNSVAKAAALVGLSERHFRRRFVSLYGATPKQYQRVIRVDRMLRTLAKSSWEQDALADYASGFADQPHASREFRLVTGMTPSAYVRAKRQGDATIRSVRCAEITSPSEAG